MKDFNSKMEEWDAWEARLNECQKNIILHRLWKSVNEVTVGSSAVETTEAGLPRNET